MELKGVSDPALQYSDVYILVHPFFSPGHPNVSFYFTYMLK